MCRPKVGAHPLRWLRRAALATTVALQTLSANFPRLPDKLPLGGGRINQLIPPQRPCGATRIGPDNLAGIEEVPRIENRLELAHYWIERPVLPSHPGCSCQA